MTYDEKIAFLRRYRDALRREKTIADEIEALRTEAARVTQALTGMPGGGDGQAIPRAVERIMDAQQRLAAEAEPLRSRDVARLTDSAAGDEKRAIKERLRAYRAAHGLGCLEQVASKIRHWRGHPDLDTAALRGLLTGDTVLSLVEWRRVGRALAALEAEETNRQK